MKKLLGLALGAVVLLLGGAASAADGDACDNAAHFSAIQGDVNPVWCIMLCDGDTGNGDCDPFDLNEVKGTPAAVSFLIHDNGTCTVGDITLGSTFDSTETAATGVNVYAIGSTTLLSVDDVTRINLDVTASPLSRYVLATRASMTCAGSLDVLMIGYSIADSSS